MGALPRLSQPKASERSLIQGCDMAPPPQAKNKPSNKPVEADDDLDHIPIQKTNPLVYAIGGIAILVVGGLGFYIMSSKKDDQAKATAAAAAAESSLAAAVQAKAAEEEKRRQMDMAIKALEAASEIEKSAAAASAAAAAAAATEEPPKTASAGGPPPAGGGDPPAAPPKPKGPTPGSKDMDDLDKLGNDTNSALGGQ